MKCAWCFSNNCKVIDTRDDPFWQVKVSRVLCSDCNHEWDKSIESLKGDPGWKKLLKESD